MICSKASTQALAPKRASFGEILLDIGALSGYIFANKIIFFVEIAGDDGGK